MAAKHHITVAEIYEGNSSDLEKVRILLLTRVARGNEFKVINTLWKAFSVSR